MGGYGNEHDQWLADLLVRVSGYSARFTELGEVFQDALIERASAGM
jgi:pyruvate-formate lyase